MGLVVHEATALAIRLGEAAGDLARAAFGSHVPMVNKSSPVDVVTEVDRSAESLIIDGLLESFPDHTIVSEEAGVRHGSSEWTWLIDPLDGTNNFTIGLPLYGLSMVLLDAGRPVLALVRDSHLSRQLVATGEGQPTLSGGLTLGSPSEASLGTVALQQGYLVDRAEPHLARVRSGMETGFRRVLYTWSPSIDVLLLVSGLIGGIVGYRCTGAEHTAALFVAEQVGCTVHTIERTACAHGPQGSDGLLTYVIGWPPVADRLGAIVASTVATRERG